MSTPAARIAKLIEDGKKFDEDVFDKEAASWSFDHEAAAFTEGGRHQHAQAKPLREALKVAVDAFESQRKFNNGETSRYIGPEEALSRIAELLEE